MVEQCLAETGMSMWLVVTIAVMAIVVGAALLYKPLRQKLGIFTLLFALAGIFSYTTPAFAAAADDCTGGTSKAPGATPTKPSNPDAGTPECIPSSTVNCNDAQVGSDAQGRIVACNAERSEVNEWTVTATEGYVVSERQFVDLDPDSDGVQRTLERPDKGFRAVYNPDNDQLTITITDAGLYPAPPAACGPCQDSGAPELFYSSWFGGQSEIWVYSDGCSWYAQTLL